MTRMSSSLFISRYDFYPVPKLPSSSRSEVPSVNKPAFGTKDVNGVKETYTTPHIELRRSRDAFRAGGRSTVTLDRLSSEEAIMVA